MHVLSHGQWWSNRETHLLQITQCFDRAGRGTRHVRHTFGWYSCAGGWAV